MLILTCNQYFLKEWVFCVCYYFFINVPNHACLTFRAHLFALGMSRAQQPHVVSNYFIGQLNSNIICHRICSDHLRL